MQVAVLGTGIMGAGMARSLLRAGHDVRVWNRSRDKAEPLSADGATVADSARSAVSGAEVVLTMLFDADSVLAVMGELLDALGPDTVWLQSSTIGRAGTSRVADLVRSTDVQVLDAPVLGTRKPAEDGALVVLASGSPELRDRVAPVLAAIGSRTVWAGDELGAASALKLACNAWVASVNAAVAQSIALASSFGLAPDLFLEAIKGGGTDTPYAHLKGAQMISGSFPASFALDGVLKDLGLIGAAAIDARVSDDLVSALQQVYGRASREGHGADDMAAVVTAFPVPNHS
jgi:3-hydroxyisobutyrate dehydrogenase